MTLEDKPCDSDTTYCLGEEVAMLEAAIVQEELDSILKT